MRVVESSRVGKAGASQAGKALRRAGRNRAPLRYGVWSGGRWYNEYGHADSILKSAGVVEKTSKVMFGSWIKNGSHSYNLTPVTPNRKMKLYSYVIMHDTGFAPNPFWGCCTLANCKPKIRKTANVGDWVVGISPKANGNRIVFAMEIDEIIPVAQYYQDPRFKIKRPDYSKGKVVYKCGDNIYKPLSNGKFQQLQSMHSDETDRTKENPETKARDLSGKNVLIAHKFYYFGSKSLNLPDKLAELKVGRAHKNKFSPAVILSFIKFMSRYDVGVKAPPSHWPLDDDSWKM